MIRACQIWLALLLSFLGFGCQPARGQQELALEAATYTAELQVCLHTSATCPGYVVCAQRAAASHGRSYVFPCPKESP